MAKKKTQEEQSSMTATELIDEMVEETSRVDANNAANVAERLVPKAPTVPTDPNMKPGFFVTLQMRIDPESQTMEMGIVQVPIDLRMIDQFQAQMGPQLAEANMKFVTVKGQVFLTPIQSSSLIMPR